MLSVCVSGQVRFFLEWVGEPAPSQISVKRVPLESNGIPLSLSYAASFATALVLEIAPTGSPLLR